MSYTLRDMGYVLLVENDDSNRAVVAGLLRREGLDVRAEAAGRDALARVMESEPGVIVLGESASRDEGTGFLKELRRTSWTGVIVLGEGDEVAAASALLMGADMYMGRPVNVRELVSRIRVLLRRSCVEQAWPPDGAKRVGMARTRYGPARWRLPRRRVNAGPA